MKRLGGVRPILVALALTLGCAPWGQDARTWAPEQQAVERGLAGHARPLTTPEGALDIGPLWSMIKAAKIVGLGEPSRNVREFRLIADAVVRRAAAEPAPLVVAIEVPFIDGLRVDAWVRGGRDLSDPGLAARELFEVFDGRGGTRALLSWIRAHNERVPRERAVRVVGLHGCRDLGCLQWVSAYVAAVDPGGAGEVHKRVEQIVALGSERFAPDDARLLLTDLRRRLEAGRAAYVAARGEEAFAAALWLTSSAARLFAPAEGRVGTIMAGTVEFAAEQVPGARIVVLAHNERTGRGHGRGETTMGAWLAERHGADYMAVHSTFDRAGRMRSMAPPKSAEVHDVDPNVDARLGYRRATVGWAPPGTLEATLRGEGQAYVLDVAEAATGEDALARWLRGTHWTRSYPDLWASPFTTEPVAWSKVTPALDHDVLVHVPFAWFMQG